MAGDAAKFSRGEQVVIDAPGWLWDRMVATVGNAWRAGADQRWLYNVTIDWPDGPRIYSLWESQLTSANDDALVSCADCGHSPCDCDQITAAHELLYGGEEEDFEQ